MTKFFFHHTLCVWLLILLLNACAPSSQTTWQTPSSYPVPESPAQQTQGHIEPVEVALLVPLSGQGAALGQAILNASQLALFDMAPQNFQIIPRDTHGTPSGVQVATQESINNGADLILGPLFSNSVKMASTSAAPYNINVIGFTTDSHATAHNSFVMGFLPHTQVESILGYAMRQKRQRFSIVVQDNQYGALVAQSAGRFLSRQHAPVPHIHTLNSQAPDLERFYNELLSARPHAVLLAVDMNTATSLSNFLISKGLPNEGLQRLGLGLWDDAQRSYSSALEGAWYTAPNPMKRERFVRLYQSTYGETPPRLASIGYDATALAISLTKRGSDYSKESLTRPNGFHGLDGIFRFHPNGLVERGLAIMEFSRGRTAIRQESPRNF